MKITRKTIEHDEMYLRQISKPVLFDNEEYKKDIKLLEKFCNETECFALAAVQIGIPKRILYLKNTSLDIPLNDIVYNESKVLINPIILERKGLTKYWEACLSYLDNMGLVNRPYEMLVKYYDVNGIEQVETFKGFEATVLSHEMDHLDGVLHIDIAEQVLNMPKEERKKFRKQHPYEIISKDCDYEDIIKNRRGVSYEYN